MTMTEGPVLFVVATPIGNLDDLSRRAEKVLRDCDGVLAEDTRRTRGLLSHLGIEGKPLHRLDAHASSEVVRAVVARLEAGERLALVTDAGTPSVSDPGGALVAAAAASGVRVVPIPGASAVLSALSVSGLGDGAFRFVGFLPRAGQERERALGVVASTPETVVLFEAPARLRETLGDLARRCPRRRAVVGRELTKLHEEVLRGTIDELAAIEREYVGEICVVIGPDEAAGQEREVSDEQIDAWIDDELARGVHAKTAAEVVSARAGRPRREIYARVLSRKGQGPRAR